MKIYKNDVLYNAGDHAEECKIIVLIGFSIFYLKRECAIANGHKGRIGFGQRQWGTI